MTIMVMKRGRPTPPPVRVSVAEAKSQLSQLLRGVDQQPVVIHNRGRDVARLVPAGEGQAAEVPAPFVRFFNRLEALRRRTGLKGVEFAPARAVIRPVDPFGEDR